MKKFVLGLIVGSIVTSGIVYAATKIQATDIEYAPNVSVKDKIDDLYTIKDTTIASLNSQLIAANSDKTALSNRITELEDQLSSITGVSAVKSFDITSQSQKFTLNFKPKYIAFLLDGNYQGNKRRGSYFYDYDYDQTNIYYRLSLEDDAYRIAPLTTFLTLNNDGFTWTFTASDWIGCHIYLIAAK